MKIVIFGKPQSGKTTLFNLLTGLGRKERHLAVVEAKDPRLEEVAKAEGSAKTTYIHIAFCDPPLRETLSEMRTGDGLIHVIRSENPQEEISSLEKDFIEKDRETLQGSLQRTRKEYSKRKDRELERKIASLEKALNFLQQGRPLREGFSRGDFPGMGLLSLKPIIHVVNAKFEDLENLMDMEIREKGRAVLAMDLLTEEELLQSNPEERKALMDEFGIKKLRAEEFVGTIYQVLDLLVFFTAGKKEARAWTLKRGATALDAAAKIHTDMARGFVRAEVASWEEFARAGGWAGLHREGRVRLEGKEYPVKDGDVLNIRFNK